ncbi:hypothetical protein [Variovorax sp. PMC12]|uniref:hypothetical protein n=1 Tax=Variovorax sp. PMC12 TaxID=2126319 RepID=UPI000D13394F|nr:hypothetical protein [Variovorax sp. PMC12]AVQ81665.1 hypothetical protein C4F17_12295 [Variovorax sp. PMC12]
MEDEDSKVRRNLVVASVVVLLAWWLGIPFDKVSDRFLGYAPAVKTFEWRVWFAAALALVYFALRFRFSEEHKKAVLVYATDRKDLSSALLRWWVKWEVSMFVRSTGRMPMPVMGTAFKTIAQAAVKEMQRNFGDERMEAKITRVFVSDARFESFSVNNGEYGVPRFKTGVVNVQFFIRTIHGEHPSRGGAQPLGFELRWLGRVIAWIFTQAAVFVYSKSGTTLMLPWVLAVVAAAVAVRRVFTAW